MHSLFVSLQATVTGCVHILMTYAAQKQELDRDVSKIPDPHRKPLPSVSHFLPFDCTRPIPISRALCIISMHADSQRTMTPSIC